MSARRILLTGATGYVGGRLLRSLEQTGLGVRILARRPHALRHKVLPTTEIVAGDVLEESTLDPALDEIDIAYYFVHSMGADRSFQEADRQAAIHFGRAARRCGVKRIIYLGGLGNAEGPLSSHLNSRQEVGHLLRESGVEVVEFRASIVIGSGSLSFEMIRALVERLPFMITPRWVQVLAQPIAIDDLLAYLIQALDLPRGTDHLYEIGGADRISYAGIMQEYARQRGLKLRIWSVPVLTPTVSSLWLGLVTPLYARVGRKLIESIIHPTVVRDRSAEQAFRFRPVGIREAVRRALDQEDREFAETRWSDALSSAGPLRSWGGVRFGTRLVDSRARITSASIESAFATVQRIGGKTGWYRWTFLWRVRGWLDLLVGGVGMRRGRPHPTQLHVGDTVDFWRVEQLEPNRHLRLVAEMKLPGRAWLEFEVRQKEKGTEICQTAIFDPVGLWGSLYWYLLYPIHELVFSGMLKGVAKYAEHSNQTKKTDGHTAVP